MVTNDRLSKRRAHTFQLVIALVMLGSGIGMAVTIENHWPGLIVSVSGAVLVVVALIELRRGRSRDR